MGSGRRETYINVPKLNGRSNACAVFLAMVTRAADAKRHGIGVHILNKLKQTKNLSNGTRPDGSRKQLHNTTRNRI